MNLLEHHIKEIHSVDDVTNRFQERNGYLPKEPFYKVDLTYNCHGQIKRETKYFFLTEWEVVKLKGYFMA